MILVHSRGYVCFIMDKKREEASYKKRSRIQGKPRIFRSRREPKWKAAVREIENVSSQYEALDPIKVSSFADLPLSFSTRQGLRSCGYSNPTDIQRMAIPLALRGKDVLGAAKTGSGKTLAFLVPLLELLWRERWSQLDGMGALVISPTRELAYQTFEVLRKVGAGHDFSAGLVTGGKDIGMEKKRILQTNIVICTPGRLLQHLDETVNFDCSSLKLLVLDEADRILDLGFEHTMNAIIQNLPPDRQTMLFSATQTKSVRDLARLSLVDSEYVAVHEHSKYSTPHKLVQSFVVCELPDKLSMLYSFMKSHLTCKIIVFMSSCKQVKFAYETFRRMRPGIPLMALYGRQKHLKRIAIFNDFCRKKESALFCTDIAARGLDIPSVDWVVQLDCPEDANTYIHRAGRTARYEKGGKALLFLLPSELEGMLAELKLKKIPIEEIKVNPKKVIPLRKKLEGFCAQDTSVKQWAQRSFLCYLKSVHLQANKKVFNVCKLPIEKYALSLGLPGAPRIRFLLRTLTEGGEDMEAEEENGGFATVDSDDEHSSVLFVKRVISPCTSADAVPNDESTSVVPTSRRARTLDKTVSKISSIKKILNKKIKLNSHIQFDEEGTELAKDTSINTEIYNQLDDDEESDADSDPVGCIVSVPISDYEDEMGRNVCVGGLDIQAAQRRIIASDKNDRKLERARIQRAHQQRRHKNRKSVSHSMGASDEGENTTEVEMSRPQAKRRRRIGGVAVCAEEEECVQLGSNAEPHLKDDEELARHLLGL